MTVTSGFAELLLETLAPLGRITVRNMFGGGGVYCEGIIFGLVIGGDNLYLKADQSTQAAFVAEGCGPFVHEAKGRPIAMPYWRMPERLLDEPDEMVAWARQAIAVARRAKSENRGKKAAKATRTSKPKPKPRSRGARSS
jgi:DNA transformation protein